MIARALAFLALPKYRRKDGNGRESVSVSGLNGRHKHWNGQRLKKLIHTITKKTWTLSVWDDSDFRLDVCLWSVRP